MSKHTPGPWLVEGCKVKSETTHEGRPFVIAETWGLSPSSRANARLIAAAPELLEAARNAETLIDDGNPGSLDEASRVLRAAIRKAVGE